MWPVRDVVAGWRQRWGGPAALTASIAAISYLHYAANTGTILVHEVLRRLYYVPIVVAATRYGTHGGLAASLFSSALYLPHIAMTWGGWPVFEVGQYGEIVLFNVVGVVTGILADRLRAERNRYRLATEQLEAAYEQIQRSVDERLKADRLATVGRMAAGMAHQIRTPLSAILGCFEILSESALGADTRHGFLEILKREIATIDEMAAAFLEFAQPTKPTPQPLDLNDIVHDAVRLVAQQPACSRTGPIDLALTEGAASAVADPNQMSRALVDLVRSVRALAKGDSVRVSTGGAPEVARLSVVIPWTCEPGPLTDLFEPFADDRLPHGLILPLVKRLVENQGGRVTALSKAGRLEFAIDLPRQDVHTTPGCEDPQSILAC